MRRDSSQDPLTGLITHVGFKRLVRMAIAKAQLTDHRHTLCLLDLNQFKVLNDACGHEAGDIVLRDVALAIQGVVPASAWVARLGGDEFLVLLSDCPLEKARPIAEDVARAIADYRFVWQERSFGVGLGIGLVEMSSESDSFEELMSIAECACIGAKSRAIPVFYFGMTDPVAARYGRTIIDLVRFFRPRCIDQSTIIELEDMALDDATWRYAHNLFCRIRVKTLQADETHNRLLQRQYLFEEICAKTLYNMSSHIPGVMWAGPFDHDSPLWLHRNAISFAEALGIDDLDSVPHCFDLRASE